VFPLHDAIPPELRALPRWVVWKAQASSDENGRQKIKKPPYSPHSGLAASVDQPANWGTFDDAWEAFERGGYAGVGFVFTPDDPSPASTSITAATRRAAWWTAGHNGSSSASAATLRSAPAGLASRCC
jgi:hypothetical protein